MISVVKKNVDGEIPKLRKHNNETTSLKVEYTLIYFVARL